MAKFKPYQCLQDQLSFLPVEDGQLVFTTDTNRIYADIGETRILFSDNASLEAADANLDTKITELTNSLGKQITVLTEDDFSTAKGLWEYDEGIYFVQNYYFKCYTKLLDKNNSTITSFQGPVLFTVDYNSVMSYTKRVVVYAADKIFHSAYNNLGGPSADAGTFVYSDYLSKTNTDSYTPTADYHPATKKYVDDNISTLNTQINEIIIPEYTMIESSTTEGYAKSYALTKDGVETGIKINVPKDLVVNSGSVKEVTTAGTPYATAAVGDKYIDLVLNDSNEDHIYIPVKDLVDVYTGTTGTKVSVSISESNEISADIVAGSITKTDLSDALKIEINTKAAQADLTQANNAITELTLDKADKTELEALETELKQYTDNNKGTVITLNRWEADA